jgi:hypothetical protein
MENLPTELTKRQLCELLGISPQHAGRLAAEGIVVMLGKDRYATKSVANVFEHMRRRGAGPASFYEARVRKVTEEALKLETERRVREGELRPRAYFVESLAGIAHVTKNRLLAVPSRFGSLIRGKVGDAKVGELVSIVQKLIRDALQDLSEAHVNEQGRVVGRRRKHLEAAE